MMPYKGFESTRDNFGKFIHQFQPETKRLIRKLERILSKLYRQNVFTSWYVYTHTHPPKLYLCKVHRIQIFLDGGLDLQ